MNLFALRSDEEEMKELLETMKVENVAFLMENRDSIYMSCTCGFCDSVDTKGWGKSIRYKYYDNERGIGKTFFCPDCSTRVVFDVYEEEALFPVKYVPTVLRDTDESIDVNISQVLVERDGSFMRCYTENKSMLIRYFKKERQLKFYILEDYLNAEEDIDYIEEEFTLNSFFGRYATFPTDYENYMQNNLVVGFKEIVDLFLPYIPNIEQVDNRRDISLYDLILDIYMSNESLLYSYLRDEKNEKGYEKYGQFQIFCKDICDVNDTFSYLAEFGIDKNAESLEIATGFSSEQLQTINGFKDLLPTKLFYEKVKEADLETYFEELGITFSTTDRANVLSIFKNSGTDDFESFMKFICRGFRNENIPIKNILEMVDAMVKRKDEEDIAKLLDYSKAFSYNLYKRFTLMRDKIISFDMLTKLSKKPTMDTLLKLIDQENKANEKLIADTVL